MQDTGGFAQREYIKIGNARFPEICTSSYLDNILLDSVRTDVTISMKKSLFMGNFITAIKESNGEITKISKGIIFSMFLNKLIPLSPNAKTLQKYNEKRIEFCYIKNTTVVRPSSVASREQCSCVFYKSKVLSDFQLFLLQIFFQSFVVFLPII